MRSPMWTSGLLVAVAVVGMFLVTRPPLPAQAVVKAPKVKWEYKTASAEKLDALGNEGWEVYAVTGGQPYVQTYVQTSTPQLGSTRNTIQFAPTVYHLKRQK